MRLAEVVVDFYSALAMRCHLQEPCNHCWFACLPWSVSVIDCSSFSSSSVKDRFRPAAALGLAMMQFIEKSVVVLIMIYQRFAA